MYLHVVQGHTLVVCMCVHMYVCICTHICIYVCIVCMYVHTLKILLLLLNSPPAPLPLWDYCGGGSGGGREPQAEGGQWLYS